ncbi:MAG TPA: zinc-dependent metalloprotease [Dermatophilaceae bacterium]|nr:zinc-dependent metalloprotease [Dermatophilaceae bacterium]
MSHPTDQPQDRPLDGAATPGLTVDWELARQTAARLAPPGPRVTPAEAAEVVASLRRAAEQAHAPVAETARMHSPAGSAPVLVVDRAGWSSANIASSKALLEPVIAKLAAAMPAAPAPSAQSIGSKITGAEMGALLAFMASKVLGQYDLAPEGSPRLLLVAPNIVQAEREMSLDPWDFRLWVALHEETHRVQFTAVPWLREHMIERSRQLAVDIAPTPAELVERISEIAQRLPDVMKPGSTGIAELLLTPEQKAKIAEITAVMSLLEGHADVVMDDVGPAVIPSVAVIREKFTERRAGLGQLDRMLRRLLGLEAKMRQYADGAVFVRAVTERVGTDGFNAVWTSPETLPTAAEMGDPQAWVARVHG